MRLVASWLGTAELYNERDVQVLDVGLVDLVKRRKPLGVISFVVGQPVTRLALRVFQPFESHFRSSQWRRQQRCNNSAGSDPEQTTCSALQRLRFCGRVVEYARQLSLLTTILRFTA